MNDGPAEIQDHFQGVNVLGKTDELTVIKCEISDTE